MKKYILKSMIFLLIIFSSTSNSEAAFAISGPSTVCVGSTYTYTLTGLPANSTLLSVNWLSGWNYSDYWSTLGELTITWYDQCPNTTILEAYSITYIDNATNQLVSSTARPTYSVSVKGLLTPVPSPAWNCSPYKCNTSNITYSVSPTCGATSYQWQIPAGWTPLTALSGANQTSITLTPSLSGTGVVSVTATNQSGGCNINRTYSCTVTRPVQPPVFTTTTTVYCLSQQSTAQFCVSPVPGATNYTWTLPSGYTIIGASNGNCITVDFHNLTLSGQICCRTNSSCGGSSVYTCLNVISTANPQFAVDIVPHPGHCDYVLNAYTYTPAITLYTWKYKKTSQSTYTTKTTAINQCNTCILQPSSTYNFNVTLTNACGATGNQTGILSTPGPCGLRESIETDYENSDEQKVFPNPASEYFNVQFVAEVEDDVSMIIIDFQGKVVNSDNLKTLAGENNFTIDTSTLTNGIYHVLLKGNSVDFNERVIIAH